MKKYTNKILLGSIIFVISLNAFAFAFVAIPSLVSAIATAARSPAVLNAAKTAFSAATSPKVAIGLSGAGVLAMGADALVSEGAMEVVPDAPSSTDSVYDYYYLDGGVDDGGVTWEMFSRFHRAGDTFDYCISYRDGVSHQNYADGGAFGFYQEGGGGIKYLTCSYSNPSSNEPDFSNPVNKSVPLSYDESGAFYNGANGEKIPVYMMGLAEAASAYQEVSGAVYDFASSVWDSITDRPAEYANLSKDQATDKANYLAGTSDPDYLINNDTLPLKPDFQTPDIEVLERPPVQSVVDNYDSNGNYLNSTIDTYTPEETIIDGVSSGIEEVFTSRETISDPSKVGTVGTGSVVDTGSTTYTGSDSLANAGTNENTLKLDENAGSNDKLLKQLVVINTQNQANTKKISDSLTGTVPTAASFDFSSDIAAYDTAQPTDETLRTSLSPNNVMDFDSYTYTVSLFGTSACHDIQFSALGTTLTLPMSGMCSVWEFFGFLIYGFSFLWSTKIVLSALRG